MKFRLLPLAAGLAAALLAGCAQPPHHADVRAEVGFDAPVRAWVPPPPPPAISVYVEPPLAQPEPVLVNVAPPPMLVEAPPPPPWPEAVWVGGYWGWQGQWVWCAGRWLRPPEPGYHWAQPYYEHRDGAVVYVAGHWAAAGMAFAPPAPGLHLSLQVSIGGGEPPVGPPGVFIPPPPGSRPGLIVPAPIGTPPAVVVSAPPVVKVGMRVTNNNVTQIDSHNVTTINNITNVTRITQVTVVAPPGATANGQAYQHEVPAQAHLAAALPAVVHAEAPRPASTAALPTFSPRQARPALPPAQPVRLEPTAQAAPAVLPHAGAQDAHVAPPPVRVAEPPPPAPARPPAAMAASSTPPPMPAPHAAPPMEHAMLPAARAAMPPHEGEAHPAAAKQPPQQPPHEAPHAQAQPQVHPQPAQHAPAPARHEGPETPRKPSRPDEERREHHGDETR
ncbi:hypothetical protein LXT12_00390 [Pelomonas sp. P7]|uniref:YXWGXW repeat-containing protein n=1 Tax=Pelomonas caseinilytica TaxID=2906763 RepID=A0ABS8X9C8_9BURK|nr:hypothetical protein [Pelomonas sp. P7]MCE4535720.1 hypothetical protein [Pelomonas sp. P7]